MRARRTTTADVDTKPILQAIAASGLSAKAFAELAGVDRKRFIRWYRHGNVSIVTAMKIAKHYGYSLDELLGDPEKWQW